MHFTSFQSAFFPPYLPPSFPGAWTHTLKVWDLKGGSLDELVCCRGHMERVCGLAWMPLQVGRVGRREGREGGREGIVGLVVDDPECHLINLAPD